MAGNRVSRLLLVAALLTVALFIVESISDQHDSPSLPCPNRSWSSLRNDDPPTPIAPPRSPPSPCPAPPQFPHKPAVGGN